MLKIQDYQKIYQAYIDTIEFHLANSNDVVKWVPVTQLNEVPSALSLLDYGNDSHNIPDYFDFMLSLVTNNSYWLFLIDGNNNILEGKHRISALISLIQNKIVTDNTKILAATMRSERLDTAIEVFLPTGELADYMIQVANQRFSNPNIQLNTEHVIYKDYKNATYRVETMTAYEFMTIYNIALRNDFINNDNMDKAICLSSVNFGWADSQNNTINRLLSWKQELCQNYKQNMFWQNTARHSDYLQLYKKYIEILEEAESLTQKDGNSIYRTIPWHKLEHEYNLSNKASPMFDWFTPLTNKEKDELVNIVVKHNFPFVIFLQTHYNHISALSRSIINLIIHGIRTQKISPSISLKVIVVNKTDRPDIHYHFSNIIEAPNFVPLKHYLVDFAVYDSRYNPDVFTNQFMMFLSFRFFDIALHRYELVLWQHMEAISKVNKKLNSIIWS